MGQFSWMSVHDHTQSVLENGVAAVLIPKEFGGGYILDESYNGYGDFDGHDVYGLVVKWNEPSNYVSDEESRGRGIDLACYEKDHCKLKYPIKIVSLTNVTGITMVDGYVEDYETNTNEELLAQIKSGEVNYETYTNFSLSDPNQGWGPPSKYDLAHLKSVAAQYFK